MPESFPPAWLYRGAVTAQVIVLNRDGRVPADAVHEGVVYDLEVDTTHTEALDCARAIAARVR